MKESLITTPKDEGILMITTSKDEGTLMITTSKDEGILFVDQFAYVKNVVEM